MRDLTKNLFSFSWAMSLFGARQLGSVLDPRQVAKGAPGATEGFGAVTDAVVDGFGRNLRQVFEAGDRVQGELVDLAFGFFGLRPAAQAARGAAEAASEAAAGAAEGFRGAARPAILEARSGAGEQVLITYTRGRGQFSQDRRFIALSNQIYDLDGRENGLHEGVWEALFRKPEDLLARPAPPTGTMTEPVGPVPSWPVSANTIAKWTHADGSSISSVGPAASHLIPLSDGSFLFLVITGQIITEGTGRFAGARGLTQSLGATHIEAGTNLFDPRGPSAFPATTLDTFKLVTDGRGRTSGSGGGAARTSRSPRSSAGGQSDAEPTACAVTSDPKESKFVEVHGSWMHYVDTGAGEPILFLHGNPTWSYLWREVLPHVAPVGRCVAPDLIGMGLSDKPAIDYGFFDHVRYLEGFIDAIGLDRYTLVLHDWGAILGFYLAMRRERQVRGLAFMEAMLRPYASWSDFPAQVADEFRKFRTPELGYRLVVEDNVFVEQLLPASTIVPLDEQTMDCYRLPFVDRSSRVVLLRFAEQLPIGGRPADVTRATARYARWLERTELPKLFLYAEPGIISTPRDVERARRDLKNLKTSFLGQGLHFFPESHPREVGQELARWYEDIRGVEPAGAGAGVARGAAVEAPNGGQP